MAASRAGVMAARDVAMSYTGQWDPLALDNPADFLERINKRASDYGDQPLTQLVCSLDVNAVLRAVLARYHGLLAGPDPSFAQVRGVPLGNVLLEAMRIEGFAGDYEDLYKVVYREIAAGVNARDSAGLEVQGRYDAMAVHLWCVAFSMVNGVAIFEPGAKGISYHLYSHIRAEEAFKLSRVFLRALNVPIGFESVFFEQIKGAMEGEYALLGDMTTFNMWSGTKLPNAMYRHPVTYQTLLARNTLAREEPDMDAWLEYLTPEVLDRFATHEVQIVGTTKNFRKVHYLTLVKQANGQWEVETG